MISRCHGNVHSRHWTCEVSTRTLNSSLPLISYWYHTIDRLYNITIPCELHKDRCERKGKLIGCSRVLRHGSEPATFRNRRGKYRKRSAGLGTVPCRAGAVSSGIAYVHFNGFYYFRRPVRSRAASEPIPVEIGLKAKLRVPGLQWCCPR